MIHVRKYNVRPRRVTSKNVTDAIKGRECCQLQDRGVSTPEHQRPHGHPASARHQLNPRLLLVHHLRRWSSIKPTLAVHVMLPSEALKIMWRGGTPVTVPPALLHPTHLLYTQNVVPANTRRAPKVIVHCWTDGVDGGPTFNQLWVEVSCVMGVCYARPRHADLCGFSSNTERYTNYGLIFNNRLRRWPSIKQTLVKRLLFLS